MLQQTFNKLPESSIDLNIGDMFLEGDNMIFQKNSKKIGDEISYFVVLSNDDYGIEYMLSFDKLEK